MKLGSRIRLRLRYRQISRGISLVALAAASLLLLWGSNLAALCLALLAALIFHKSRKDLQGFAGIARNEDEKEHIQRLRGRGLITPLPEDMPQYFAIPPGTSKEALRLAWSCEGNLLALKALLEAKTPLIAISGCSLTKSVLQVHSDPALMNYFCWRGRTAEQAAAEANEVLTIEPSMYAKEIGIAVVDYGYRPCPIFKPKTFGLPPRAVLLLAPEESHRGKH